MSVHREGRRRLPAIRWPVVLLAAGVVLLALVAVAGVAGGARDGARLTPTPAPRLVPTTGPPPSPAGAAAGWAGAFLTGGSR